MYIDRRLYILIHLGGTCGFLPVEPVVVVGHRDDTGLRVQHERRVFEAQHGRVPDAAESPGVRVCGLDGDHADAGRGILRQLRSVRGARELRRVVVDVVQVHHHGRPGRRLRAVRISAAATAGHGQLGGHHLYEPKSAVDNRVLLHEITCQSVGRLGRRGTFCLSQTLLGVFAQAHLLGRRMAAMRQRVRVSD